MAPKTVSWLLGVAAILLAMLALATLLPHTSMTVSDLGYDTLCPFAPWSTLALLALAGLAWAVRRHVNAQPAE